jgi:hypothetical protein
MIDSNFYIRERRSSVPVLYDLKTAKVWWELAIEISKNAVLKCMVILRNTQGSQ